MEMQKKEILELAFTAMPNQFTSNMFGRELRRLGMPEYFFRSGGSIAEYLHYNAYNEQARSKTWIKNHVQNSKPQPVQMQACESIESMIQKIKAAGYKVLKRVDRWDEV